MSRTQSIIRSSRGCGRCCPRTRPTPIRRLRRENLAGLSGRVLEVGAGTGTNFEFYPDTVTEVVAVEPERRLAELAQQAAAAAPVPVTVSTDTVEQFVASGASRSTRWCARWCCARSMSRTVFCGSCFRCCARAGSCATSSTSRAAGRAHGCRSSPTPRCGRGCWATATPTGTPRRRSSAPGSGGRRPPRVDDAGVGAAAGGGVRDRPRGQGEPSRAARAAAAAGRATHSPPSHAATPSRRRTAAWARG